MNVSELARQLRVHPQKLLQILPEFGFDIGAKSIKIDDRVAQQIQREWRRIKYILDERERKEKEEEKEKEKEQRRESGVAVSIPSVLTVRQLADKLQTPINKLMLELMKNGILATQNENIDHDTAVLVAEEMGFSIAEEEVLAVTEENTSQHVQNLEKTLGTGATVPRPPVIVVMGHVDHGKTKLLDAIRSTNVVAQEAGGITQHIGAYQVVWNNPKTKAQTPLTFIDTPGHEAFTVMRSRGAKVADIAILVVAADDGVKPQTIEAINIIKAAKLPVVVAINKIDREGADPQRVRTELSQHNILADDWGGDVPMVEISAKQNLNIDKLLDTLLLVAEMNAENIKANPDRPAAGTVIEAHVDKGQGPVATILVQTGTLHNNDPLVVNGEIYGKVRAMKNYRTDTILEAGPSCPVRILGFKIAPQVGDVLDVSQAGDATEINLKTKRTQQSGAEQRPVVATDENDEEAKQMYNIVLKTDMLGSLEAIVASLEKISHDEVGVKVVGKGLGNITADDISLAAATGATVFGFNVNTTPIATEMMQNGGVQFKQYHVIYDLLDYVKGELEKMLNPELIVTELGNFKVIALFRTEKNSMVVGGRVEKGKILRNCLAHVKRGGEIIGKGKITKLQISKQEMNEVPEGSECGIQFEGKLKLEVGDLLEAYKEEKKEKKLVLNV
ncbi:MAG: Translation initiation factor IF-2 [Candidatus Magasanikbacteria bacterium GW2011_GWC2_34_16]|uniref:Translation initiation factor IF-2 n=1 Tax=Candidatus Magasanikbacteria bacterium GW2011_GWC2_34_16 TaxID=1619045 RepID=A0A0G0D871_9BACT|nr:MAG: Translation initiation factor IF-2 [Candidatus Magasanikbacteria bacterium GW2011_GWC2_34_16]